MAMAFIKINAPNPIRFGWMFIDFVSYYTHHAYAY